jgi:hypothetical protein
LKKSWRRFRRSGGTPLVVATREARARRDSSEGHRQRRHQADRFKLSRDGHPHRDDHRRQQADRRRHRAEAGVDDFLAEAKPEDKLALIRKEQPAAAWSR